MTNKEILTKAIEKAQKNGYTKNVSAEGLTLNLCNYEGKVESDLYKILIFNINFAKAFWGTDYVFSDGEFIKDYINREYKDFNEEDRYDIYKRLIYDSLQNWQYHLQKLVLEEEPLKYLERFLDKEK